ncbi:MAG: heparinase II/III domain-containing protein [Bacteroidales bacterium]
MKKLLFTTYLLILSTLFTNISILQSANHPRILVKVEDRELLLNKIQTNSWAKSALESLRGELWPFVSRYAMTIEYDPAVLTSRYRMNWREGYRYTDAIVDDSGRSIIQQSGDASGPTVRFSEKGYPADSIGFEYEIPSVHELIPYDVDSLLRVRHPLSGDYVRVKPKELDALINSKINAIALKSAFVYWLTNEEEYGYLAADILDQWMKASLLQNSIVNGNIGGIFCVDTEDDSYYNELLLAYDFIHDFMLENGYEVAPYQSIFESLAENVLHRGSITNNSFIKSSSTLLFSAMNIEDNQRRENFVEYFISKDTIVDKQFGHLSLKSIISQRFTPQGYLKSPARLQNEILPQLLMAVYACELNGYSIVGKYPQLLDTYSQMLQNSFPNLNLPAFGDAGREKIDPLIIALSMAINRERGGEYYANAVDALRKLAHRNCFDLDKSGLWGLIFINEDIDKEKATPYYWQNFGSVEYARNFFVRSGMNPNKDQMITLQGGTFSNNHADGLSMELYDKGVMLGSDPGTLRDLFHPMHIDYYSQWAAHNTVVPAGSASPDKLFKGGDAAKSIGNMDRTATGMTQSLGFISGRYTERYTKTNQERTVAYIRTSDSAGYFVDIFRSNNRLMNDYIYHNIGDSVNLYDHSGAAINLIESTPFTVEPDFPGIRFIENTKSTGKRSKGVVATFSLNDSENNPLKVQTLFVSNASKNYYVGSSPRSITAHAPYNLKPTPTVLVRQEGEAWHRPFTAVIEAYKSLENPRVLSAEWEKPDIKNRVAALKVTLDKEIEHYVFQSPEPIALFKDNAWSFSGYFGLLVKENGNLKRMEMAKGKVMGYGDFTFTAKDANANFTIELTNDGFIVETNQQLEVKYTPYSRISKKSPQIDKGGTKQRLAMKRRSKDTFIVPAVKNGVVRLK